MKKIGITGGIGSGKSTVSKIIETLGFPVFYSDEVAKNILNTDNQLKQKIINLFGDQAYLNNHLNRPFIASKIFNDKDLKNQLNQIVHPAVRIAFENWSNKQNANLIFNEAAILFETGSYKNFDKNILITADLETRVARVMKRDNCSRDEVLQRINNQWSDEQKIKLADFVIHNNDDSRLIVQVEEILKKFMEMTMNN